MSAIFVLVILWLLIRMLVGSRNLWKLVEGFDGQVSTSKLQWFLWTVVVIFSYAAVYAARVWTGDFRVISDVPQNLLIAMGPSVTMMVAAIGITVVYVSSGQATKGKTAPERASDSGSIIKDDARFSDLTKIQMIARTIVAIGMYLIRLVDEIETVPQSPDAGFQCPTSTLYSWC